MRAPRGRGKGWEKSKRAAPCPLVLHGYYCRTGTTTPQAHAGALHHHTLAPGAPFPSLFIICTRLIYSETTILLCRRGTPFPTITLSVLHFLTVVVALLTIVFAFRCRFSFLHPVPLSVPFKPRPPTGFAMSNTVTLTSYSSFQKKDVTYVQMRHGLLFYSIQHHKSPLLLSLLTVPLPGGKLAS